MLIYMLIILEVLFLGCIFNVKDKNSKKAKWFTIFSFILLTVVSAIRSKDVGVDSLQYYNNYRAIGKLDWGNIFQARYEYGYTILCKFLYSINKEAILLFAVSSIFINTVIGKFIYKYSKNIPMSILLYILLNYYFSSMNIMRQFIGIGFLLIALDAFVNKKNTKFFIFVAIASFFHLSSLLFAILYFFRNKQFGRKEFIYTIVISIVSFIGLPGLLNLGFRIFSKYSTYVGGDYDVANYFGAVLKFGLNFMIFIIVSCISIKAQANDKKENIFLFMLAISIVFSFCTIRMAIFNRVTGIFSIICIILLPNSIEKISEKKMKLFVITFVAIICFSTFGVISIYRPEWYGVIPYKVYQLKSL